MNVLDLDGMPVLLNKQLVVRVTNSIFRSSTNTSQSLIKSGKVVPLQSDNLFVRQKIFLFLFYQNAAKSEPPQSKYIPTGLIASTGLALEIY